MADIMTKIIEKAQNRKRHIVLLEGFDERMVIAAGELAQKEIIKVTLIGEEAKVKEIAASKNVDLAGVNIVDPNTSEWHEEFSQVLYERRKKKGMTIEQAREKTKNFLYFGNLMVKTGKADGSVGGAFSTTADVMRACLQVVGVKQGTSLVSSSFLMVMPDARNFMFSDCALVPDPDEEGLASIAVSTAETFKSITGEEPRVAMLSFSTMGSGGEQPSVVKVRNATKIAQAKNSGFMIDGELQFDAALLPEVGKFKAPNSPVAGQANVFVFPDLNAGNIGYKIAQRLGGAKAIGPFVQGLDKPCFDLSRGCSVEDIVNTAAVCSVMS